MWDLYVFDSIEASAAATTVGGRSKMCPRFSALIVTQDPNDILQTNTLIEWSWCAVQSIGLIAQDPAKWRPY